MHGRFSPVAYPIRTRMEPHCRRGKTSCRDAAVLQFLISMFFQVLLVVVLLLLVVLRVAYVQPAAAHCAHCAVSMGSAASVHSERRATARGPTVSDNQTPASDHPSSWLSCQWYNCGVAPVAGWWLPDCMRRALSARAACISSSMKSHFTAQTSKVQERTDSMIDHAAAIAREHSRTPRSLCGWSV